MTGTDLARIEPQLIEMRDTLRGILDGIRVASSADFLQDALTRTRLAREWAKIHHAAAELKRDLLRAEIYCVRRVAQLGATGVLTSHYTNALPWFEKLSDDDIEQLMEKFPNAGTALSLYRADDKAWQYQCDVDYGESIGLGKAKRLDAPDHDLDKAIRKAALDSRAGLSLLMHFYASQVHPFTIGEMAEEFSERCGFADTDGVQQGIAEICRKAVRSAPEVSVEGTLMPRFVTFICDADDDGRAKGQTVRIPVEYATARQFAQMIELRREQLRQDQDALLRLEEAYRVVQDKVGERVNATLSEIGLFDVVSDAA